MTQTSAVYESNRAFDRLDLSAQNSHGNTSLHEIAAKTYDSYDTPPEKIKKLEENEIQNIKLILKYNPDINIKNLNGYTSVHLAIQNKKSDLLVKVLLDHTGYCDYNATDSEGCTALYHAVSPTSYKQNGWMLYYFKYNFKFRDVVIIKRLIEKGAKVDIAAKNGYSPLIWAVMMRKLDYVKVMLESKDNLSDGGLEQTVNTFFVKEDGIQYPPVEYYNMTPLLVAVYDNNKEIARMLINAGANVNAVNENSNNEMYYKMTPLLISVYNCNQEIAKLLINGGANVNVVNINKDNALLMITKETLYSRYVAIKDKTKIAKLLVDSGINLDAKDGSGATALHLAISKDKQNIVTYILEQGLSTWSTPV